MNLGTLELFLDVVHRLSFAAVAEDRGVNASSVSRAIGQLEDELGTRLLQRTTRRMMLTEAGETFYLRVRDVLDELEQAKDRVRTVASGPSGTLKLTSSVSFGEHMIMPLMPRFRATYPDIKLELMFSDTNFDLVTEGIDLAVRLGSQMTSDLIITRLLDTRYRVCASPEFLKGVAPLNTPSDLSAHRCVRFTLPSFRPSLRFRKSDPDADPVETVVPIAGDIAIASAISLRTAVLQGMGPALLADWLIRDDLKSGRLVDVFPDYEVTATDFDTAVWALYPSRSYLPQKVRVMVDFLRAHLTR